MEKEQHRDKKGLGYYQCIKYDRKRIWQEEQKKRLEECGKNAETKESKERAT